MYRVENRRSVMTNVELERKIALLESVNDQLTSELQYVDQLMRQLGFAEGLLTIKSTAQEILAQSDVEGEDQAINQ